MEEKILNALVMAYCFSQSKMYEDALKRYENGYTPKTNIWEVLTVAETRGVEPVVDVVATVVTAAKFDGLIDPVTALCDLVMAIKYKTKFFDPNGCKDGDAIKIMNNVYNKSLDVVSDAICNGDIPSDIADKVSELIYA